MGEEERNQSSQGQLRRNGFLATETARAPSKLSAEIIQAEVSRFSSHDSTNVLIHGAQPSLASPTRMSADETDHTKSELYQRTQKAKEKLESDRKKRDSSGGAAKTLSRASSFVNGDVSSVKTKRRTFGWFKSSSATTLPLTQSTPALLPLSSTQSSKTIPAGMPISTTERRSSNTSLSRSAPGLPAVPQEYPRRSTPTPSPPLQKYPASPARLSKAISTVLPASPAPSPPIPLHLNEMPRPRKSPLQELVPLPLTHDLPAQPHDASSSSASATDYTSPPSSSESFPLDRQAETKKSLVNGKDSAPERHVVPLISVAGVKDNLKGRAAAPAKPGFFNRFRKSFSGPISAGKLPSPAKSASHVERRQSVIKPNRSLSTKKQSRNTKGSSESAERPRKTSFFGSFSRSNSSSSLAGNKTPKSTLPPPPLPTQRPSLSILTQSQASDRPPRENRPSITGRAGEMGATN